MIEFEFFVGDDLIVDLDNEEPWNGVTTAVGAVCGEVVRMTVGTIVDSQAGLTQHRASMAGWTPGIYEVQLAVEAPGVRETVRLTVFRLRERDLP